MKLDKIIIEFGKNEELILSKEQAIELKSVLDELFGNNQTVHNYNYDRWDRGLTPLINKDPYSNPFTITCTDGTANIDLTKI